MGCGASTGGGGERFDPNTPISLNHFKVERVLGEGGFGKVKYVRHKGTDQGYAMKCMDKHIVRHTTRAHRGLCADAVWAFGRC